MKIRLCEATIYDINRRFGNNIRKRRSKGYKVKVKEYTINPLYIVFEVTGGTHPYEVDLAFKDVNPKSKRAIENAIKNNQILIGCSCSDFRYRFSFNANKNGFGFNTEHRPAKITNPNDSLGPACKHVAAVLDNLSWVSEVANGIKEEESKEKERAK